MIGGENFKRTYLEEKVSIWVQKLTLLSKIATTQPQAAYSCFTAGYQYKLTCFLRTISGCEEHLVPVDEVIRHKFIPALTGGHVVNELERQLLALPPRLGGLGLKIFSQNAVEEYQNSTSVTVELQEQILGTIIDEERKKRSQVKSERQRSQQTKLDILLSEMSQEDQRRTQANGKKGVSNWLTSLPMRNHGFDLSKQEFREAIRMRYGWALDRLPAICVCGSRFGVPHALSCKRGGFVTLRHNELRNITADLLREVCVGKNRANAS